MTDAEVLIAGAGPIGLTAAIELARRGIACRIVDPLLEPPQYAKAVGVQPRTLEVFEGMGVLRRILDDATPMRGQVVYVNGEQVGAGGVRARPPDVPFGFVAIPQYATERILREELATLRRAGRAGLALAELRTGRRRRDRHPEWRLGRHRARGAISSEPTARTASSASRSG